MKTKLVIILGLLLASSLAQLSFNTNNCKTERFVDWDAVTCPCERQNTNYNVADLEYQFTNLPQGWYANKQKIYVPRGKLQQNRNYGAKVTVYDKNAKQYLKKSLIFNFDSDNKFNRAFDGDFDLNVDDRFAIDQFVNNRIKFANNGFGNTFDPRAPQVIGNTFDPARIIPSVISNSFDPRQQAQQAQQFIPQFAPQVAQQVIPQQFIPQVISINNKIDDDKRRNNPYYDNFPRDEDIEKILDVADCGKIRDIIKYVGASGFQCRDSASFLDKFQSKIQSRIAIYRADAERNRQNIFKLQDECKKSDGQIQEYRKRSVNVDSINDRIRGYRDEISRHTRDRQSYEGNCKDSRNNVAQWRAEIENIRGSTGAARNICDQESRRLNDIDAQIAQLQDRIRGLKRDRQQSANNRDRNQRIVDDAQRRIDDLTGKCNSLQDQINGYQTKSKYCADAIVDFNRKIEDANREIEGSRFRDDDKIRQMRDRQNSRQQELAKAKSEIDRLVNLYTEMEKYQEEFGTSISKHYYGCYQSNPIVNNNDKYDNNKFTAPSNAFLSYMKEVFGQAPNENIRARFSGTAVNVKRNTIFSPAWTKVYGIPFSAGYGNNLDVMKDNFSCTQSDDKLKVFSGTIVDINKNVIEVSTRNGDRYTVHLGGCTKLESITQKELPEKGSEIYFKGFERQEKAHYDGYHVTCY